MEKEPLEFTSTDRALITVGLTVWKEQGRFSGLDSYCAQAFDSKRHLLLMGEVRREQMAASRKENDPPLPAAASNTSQFGGQPMRRLIALAVIALGALAAPKDSGTTTLKDVQPAGTPDKKQKQQYDLFFVSSTGKDYTCRTSEKKSVKATDLVVGSTVNYKIDEEKARLKTSAGKEFSCVIVRVANAAANAAK